MLTSDHNIDTKSKISEDIKKELSRLYSISPDFAVEYLDEIKERFGIGDSKNKTLSPIRPLHSNQLIVLKAKGISSKELLCIVRRCYGNSIVSLRTLSKIKKEDNNFTFKTNINGETYYTQANEMSIKEDLNNFKYTVLKDKNDNIIKISYSEGLELCLKEVDAIIESIF